MNKIIQLKKEIKKKLRPIRPFLYFFINKISKIHRYMIKPTLPKNMDGKILIHLGCGRENDSRYINVDALTWSHIHYISMVEKIPMFSDNYADLIYASHILEHIPHKEVKKVLSEWKRVLKKGGTIRLAVPNFDKLIAAYHEENDNMDSIINELMGGQDYVFNFHKSMFNEKSLSKILEDIGFKDIKIWDPNNAEFYNFKDCANYKVYGKYPISLNIEATKI